MSGFLYFLTDGNYVAAIAFMTAAITAIVLHELAHGYAAIKNGDFTPRMYGRMTLNPVKHFDLFGFLMFAFVGFGWARPVPVNPRNFRNLKRGMFFVSTAGVFVNFCLAFISVPIMYFLARINMSGMQQFPVFLITLAYLFFFFLHYISLILFVFNLLPIAPLDGFRIVQTFTKPYNPYTRFMTRYGQYVLIGFIALSYILSRFGISILGTLQSYAAYPIEKFWGLFLK